MSESNGALHIARKGRAKFDIGGSVFEVDLFQAWNAYLKAEESRPAGDLSPLVEWVKSLGAPPDLTQAEAVEFVNVLGEQVEGLKKKVGTTPSSPASTTSTPSA